MYAGENSKGAWTPLLVPGCFIVSHCCLNFARSSHYLLCLCHATHDAAYVLQCFRRSNTAVIAQLGERKTEDLKVSGSIPDCGSSFVFPPKTIRNFYSPQLTVCSLSHTTVVTITHGIYILYLSCRKSILQWNLRQEYHLNTRRLNNVHHTTTSHFNINLFSLHHPSLSLFVHTISIVYIHSPLPNYYQSFRLFSFCLLTPKSFLPSHALKIIHPYTLSIYRTPSWWFSSVRL